jgi:hypothetical protein
MIAPVLEINYSLLKKKKKGSYKEAGDIALVTSLRIPHWRSSRLAFGSEVVMIQSQSLKAMFF